eukprot:5630964-Prymnesium_polylepis.1
MALGGKQRLKKRRIFLIDRSALGHSTRCTCRAAGRARSGAWRRVQSLPRDFRSFTALPSLGRGGHFRSLSPTFGGKVLSQH